MHSATCGVGASMATNSTSAAADGFKMVLSNDDAMNKIPLKSATGLDDEEKNGGEFIHDTAAAEEARREQMRANILKWMKKLTIVIICFIGIALISYVIISLCFSDWHKSSKSSSSSSSSNPDDNDNNTISDSTTINTTTTSIPNNATSQEQQSDRNNVTVLAAGAAAAASIGLRETTESISGSSSSSTINITPASVIAQTTTTAATIIPNASATTTQDVTQKPKDNKTMKPNDDDNNDDEDADKLAMNLNSVLQDVPINQTAHFKSKLGVFKKAAVCSDKEVCSQIGSNILAKGGSAVDSAIATLLCNGIVTMQSMGIGGGMLMNVYTKSNKHAYSIDAREVAPFAAYPEMFDENLNGSLHGGLSIAVPGELMGYHRAHERFGKLPWKSLIEPSLEICNDGFYLSEHQWNAINFRKDHIKNNTLITQVFMNSTTGELHPVGTKLKPQAELCETYVLLAKNGPLDFYTGTLARLVAEDLKDLGSTIASDDLESYAADLVSSITMPLGDDILYALPPISSSTVVANILSVLEGYNLTRADVENPEREATTVHRFVEAMKFGFAKRGELGDLRFNDVRELVSRLTNPENGIDIRKQINDTSVHQNIYDYGIQYAGLDDVGTSHTVVLAPNGDAVSVTSSVNDYFGAGQAGKRTGIIFNSAMSDFSVEGRPDTFGLPPSPTNFIEARKRPMSSMSPMILASPEGDVRMIIGAAGGSKIISAIVEVAARVLWFGLDIKAAIDAPRFHHQLLPNVLEYQKGISEKVLKLLEEKGHKTKPYQFTGSVVCGIVKNATAIYANADYRKQGGVAGF